MTNAGGKLSKKKNNKKPKKLYEKRNQKDSEDF